MRKLLIVISSMTFGGAEIQTLQLANGLVTCGYDIDIVILDNKQEIIKQAHPKIQFHIMHKKHYLDWDVVKRLDKLIRNLKPDVIFCVDLYPTLYTWLSLKRIKKQVLIATAIHSTLPLNIKEKFQRFYLTKLLKNVDRLIFVSEKQMHYWLKNYNLNKEKVMYIHNGIDIDRFAGFPVNGDMLRRVREQFHLSENDIVIGNCSKFRVEKRHQDLIETVSRLREEGYPVRLLLIGDGEMRPQIESQIQALKLENVVGITGHVLDVRPYLAVVDVFVLTSNAVETLSIAAIESQAMKKAVVLSEIGGASEIVVDGVNGYLYPAGDVDQLTAKIRMILVNRSWKIMGEEAYEHASQHFQSSRMVAAYNQVFKSMMGESDKG